MPLFYSTYEIIPDKRSDCLTLFGGMSEEDDKKDVGEDIKIYGRWGSPGEGTGVCVYEAPDSKTVANWLQNWIEMGTVRAGDGGPRGAPSPDATSPPDARPPPHLQITTTVVVDDNSCRKIVLKGEEPKFQFDTEKYVMAEPLEGEGLYHISYAFKPGCQNQGYEILAQMTEEQDTADAGACTVYGRWHDMCMGRGYCIASAKTSEDIFKWAWNWHDLCDVEVKPVCTDNEMRAVIKSKPGFAKKHAALIAKMTGASISNGH